MRCSAGTTRDAVELPWESHGRAFCLVDTAGMRRWGVWDAAAPLEGLSAARARQAMATAHVALLVVDATAGLSRQDAALAESVVEEGRALVVALTKWDMVEQDAAKTHERQGAQREEEEGEEKGGWGWI